MDFAWNSEELCLKLFWKNLISVSLARNQTFFTGSYCFNRFLFFERFNKELSLFRSLLLLNFIKKYYLLIVFRGSKRSCLDEIAKYSRLSELVNEGISLWAFPLGTELLKIEAVSWIHSIWYGAVLVVNVLEKLSVVRHDFRHEL